MKFYRRNLDAEMPHQDGSPAGPSINDRPISRRQPRTTQSRRQTVAQKQWQSRPPLAREDGNAEIITLCIWALAVNNFSAPEFPQSLCEVNLSPRHSCGADDCESPAF